MATHVKMLHCWKSHVTAHIVFLSLKTDVVLANSAEPGEMLQFAAFHLCLQCLQKYQSMGCQSTKGLEKIKQKTSRMNYHI